MTADRGANNEDPTWSFGASVTFPDLNDGDPFPDAGPFSVPSGTDHGGSGSNAPTAGSPTADPSDPVNPAPTDAGQGAVSPGSESTLSSVETTDQTADSPTRITRLDYGRHIKLLLVEPDAEAAAAYINAGRESVLDVRIEVTESPESAFSRLERSAGQLLRKPLPDIVVTSIAVAEAHRLLEMLRQDARFDNLPVLVLAPSASSQDERRSFALGAAAHMATPSRDYERVALMHALPDFIPSARAAHAHLESHRR